MYRVSYYMSGSSMISTKLFNTLTEAIRFSVYNIKPGWDVNQIIKVD